MTKSSKKKSIWKSRFYQVYFIVVALALIAIFVGTVWLRGVLRGGRDPRWHFSGHRLAAGRVEGL